MNKQAWFFASMVVLFSVLVSSCSLLQSTSSGGGESYFPSAIGNTWFSKGTDGTSSLTTVEGTITIGSITAKRFRSYNVSSPTYAYTNEVYYKVDSTGVYVHGQDGVTSSMGIPLLSFPLEVGKSWDIMVSGLNSTRATVLAKETITVPAGTFDCYKIVAVSMYGTIETYRSYLWLGNNAGMVKVTMGSSTVESVLQWKSF